MVKALGLLKGVQQKMNAQNNRYTQVAHPDLFSIFGRINNIVCAKTYKNFFDHVGGVDAGFLCITS